MYPETPGGNRIVEIGGGAFEAGRALGRLHARAVAEKLVGEPAWREVIQRGRADERVPAMLAQVEERFPDILMELKGLADGLGQDFADVFTGEPHRGAAVGRHRPQVAAAVPGEDIVERLFQAFGKALKLPQNVREALAHQLKHDRHAGIGASALHDLPPGVRRDQALIDGIGVQSPQRAADFERAAADLDAAIAARCVRKHAAGTLSGAGCRRCRSARPAGRPWRSCRPP